MHHSRDLDAATLFASGGLCFNLFGTITADQVASFTGTALAVGGAVVSWYLSQRARVNEADLRREADARDAKRREDLLDFEQRLRLRELEREAKQLDSPVEPKQPPVTSGNRPSDGMADAGRALNTTALRPAN